MQLAMVSDTYPPQINGVAGSLQSFAQGLAARGHGVLVITAAAAEAGVPETAIRRVVLPSLPLPRYPGLRLALPRPGEIEALLKAAGTQVLYVATESLAGWSAQRAAARLGLPVISGFHTHFQDYLPGYRLPGLQRLAKCWLRSFHARSRRVLTPGSQAVAMLKAWGLPSVGLLGRGVDTQRFSPLRRCAELRAQWGAGDQTPVLLLVGRVATEKNLPLFLRAVQRFRAHHPKAVAVVVGDGPLWESLRHGHPEVHWLGARTGLELARCYASADYFIFPSLSETYGNVVAEAMASGLAVVAYDDAAAALLIQSGRSGWLAARGDESAFLQRADEAAQSWASAGLVARREAARDAVKARGWDQVVGDFEAELQAQLH